jgi:hypothetical protein
VSRSVSREAAADSLIRAVVCVVDALQERRVQIPIFSTSQYGDQKWRPKNGVGCHRNDAI